MKLDNSVTRFILVGIANTIFGTTGKKRVFQGEVKSAFGIREGTIQLHRMGAGIPGAGI